MHRRRNQSLGKVTAPEGLADVIDRSGFIEAPVIAADAEAAAALEPVRRDPFDRVLVAQASRLRAIVVTRDAVFSRYHVETIDA